MGGLCIEWEIPDLVRLWNSRFKIQGWEDLSFFIKLQAKMLHFLWGKSSSSYWNSKSWKVLKQILLQNVTKILKGIRVWALFYAFKILVNLNLLYCKAACWNLLGQMYSILHRYKQDSANQNKLKFQGGWISLIFKERLVKCLIWNLDKILQNLPLLDRPLYIPQGVKKVRFTACHLGKL